MNSNSTQKYLTTCIIALTILSFNFYPVRTLNAETITITDPIENAILDAHTQVNDLKTAITAYKKAGISNEEKTKLLSRISSLKASLTTLKAKINAMQKAPVTVLNPTTIPIVTITLGSIPSTVYKGDTTTVTWSASASIPSVGIVAKSTTDPMGVYPITTTAITASQKSYAWIPTTIPNDTYRLFVYNGANSAIGTYSNSFTLMQKPQPTPSGSVSTVSLFTPNGYETIQTDSSYTIRWNTTGIGRTLTVNVRNSNNIQTIVGQSPNNQSSNSILWNIPATFAPGSYKVQLVDTASGKIMAESSNWFILSAALERIDSVSPTSGPVGTDVIIRGKYFLPTNNSVVLGGPSVLTQYIDSPDTTTIHYVIPTAYKVSPGSWQFYVGLSNRVPFTLTSAQGFFDILPNSAVKPGQTYTLVWNGPTMPNVIISIFQGSTVVQTINPGTMVNGGRVTWNIPSNFLGNYELRAASGANDISVYNNNFNIGTTAQSPSPSSTPIPPTVVPSPSSSPISFNISNLSQQLANIFDIIDEVFGNLIPKKSQ